ncbi:MAG TPA: hypothetical protein VEJ20_08205, partial [Candidatus Eremiobacteraceae bacterium]|nr:hypothetical protein [Candidatus Eremiobacteraceae bacterium]
MVRMLPLCCSFLLAFIAFVASPAGARPVEAEDLFKLSFLSGATISHDGSQVAYVVTKLDGVKNTYLSNIWIADVASGKTWQLTRGDSDDSPNWSPDDKWIAFDSGRGDKGQIYRIALGGGEAQRLTDLPNGASGPTWSHDGTRILFQATTIDKPAAAHIDFSAAGFTPTADQRTSDVRIITVQHYEDNGAGFTYTQHAHIWVMAADGTNPHALTSGHSYSENNAAWSPDDKWIAFDAFYGPDPYGYRGDVYVMPATGGAPHRVQLAAAGNGFAAWAHDGSGIYYFQTREPDPSNYPALDFAKVDGSGQRELVGEDKVAWGDAVITDTTNGGAGCGPIFDPHDSWFLAAVSTPGA